MKKIIANLLTIFAFSFSLTACTGFDISSNNSNATSKHTHSYSSEMIKATCVTDGYTYHYCNGCGDSYKDNVVKALGHDYVEREQNYKCSRCGRYEDDGFTFELVTSYMSDYDESLNGRVNTYQITSASSKAVEDGKLTLPRKYMGFAVTGIRNGALYNVRSSMKEIQIPSNIKYIGSLLVCYDGGYYRPSGTIALKTIKFDNNCSNMNISHSAFEFCENVTDIVMPNDCIARMNHDDLVGNHFLFEDTQYYLNNRIEENGCYYLFNILMETDKKKVPSSITIKNGTKMIANQAFIENTNIRTVVLPSSLIYIGRKAFAQCVSLQTIIFKGTESQYKSVLIEEYAFQDCKTINYQYN